MFHKTSTKLTALYLGILMLISLFFSVNVYHLSVSEFDRDYQREITMIGRVPGFRLPADTRQQLIDARVQQFEEAKSHVLGRLFVVNCIILVGGGFLSYYLARRTLQPIERAHEAQSRFTADASHELRTPIAAMRSEIEVALMNPKLTLKDAKSLLQSNLEELEKLTSLSQGLLRLAQLETIQELDEKANIKEVISQAIARTELQATHRNIKLNVKTITATVQGETSSLVEALVTIIDNAIKYSPEGEKIEVTASKNNKQVVVTVSDHGIGIKPDELPHIFDRFYRADSARNKQTTDGYGLGLAIAKNIIDFHNGNIQAASKPGEGTTFIISLPLATPINRSQK